MAEEQEVVGFDFDGLTDEELAEVAESIGLELLPVEGAAEQAEEGAEAEGEESVEEEAEEQAPDSAEAHGEANPDSAEAHGSLDPAGMAAVAQSCADESAAYVEKLVQLAEQVMAGGDKKAGKAVEKIAKKAQGFATDISKLAEKAKKAAEKDRLGEAADLAREASDVCAELRALIDEAKSIVGGADLPEDEEPAPMAEREPKTPTRSSIEAWASDMLG